MSATSPASTRRARRNRLLALALAVAIATSAPAGLQLAGPATRAEATQFLNGWKGAFTRDELYAIGTSQPNSVYAWDKPWTQAALPTAPLIFDKSKGSQGTSLKAPWDTFAVGPVYAARGDYTLHGLGWAADNKAPATLMERDNARNRLNAIGTSSFGGATGGYTCATGKMLGGEINQHNGLIYNLMTASADQKMAANATTTPNEFRLSIYQIVPTAGGSPQMSCRSNSRTGITAAGRTIAEEWAAQFPSAPPIAPTSNWGISSDVAIGADGHAYVLAHNAADRHALIRINVPQTADGQPIGDGRYTFEVVRFFTAPANNDANHGLTFMDGKLYVQDALGGIMWRYDPLTGAVENLGSGGPTVPMDLASAQMAPVVEGTVFNDANANSAQDAGEAGVGGLAVEVWQRPPTDPGRGWQLLGEVATNAQGRYSVLAPTTSGEFLLRLREPRVNGVNATQTYASAGDFKTRDGATTTVRARCFNQAGDYQSVDRSGACYGGRSDGIDPPQVTDPLAAVGGAAIVTRVDMASDLAAVTADFGVTAAGSWGDAPAVYHTSNAEDGPYANPRIGSDDYLYLGTRPGVYADGQPSAAADAHPTDDSLQIAPKLVGVADQDLTWRPAQDQLIVAGHSYRVRAEASGLAAAVASSHVKAWITGLTGAGTAAGVMDQTLLGAGGCADTPDADGYVYCDYQPAATPPAGAVAPVFARVRVGAADNFTATSRGPADTAAEAWMPKGEIEDYRLGVAEAALRIDARNLGGVDANVGLALTNVATTAPSGATADILTDSDGAFTASSTGHALLSRTAATVIATTSVGASGAAGLNGWAMATRTQGGKPIDTYCHDTFTGADLGAVVDQAAGTLTIPAPATGRLPQDITCRLTYTPQVDVAASTVTADPSGNSAPADRLPLPDGTSEVKVRAASEVQDSAGHTQSRPSAGVEVKLELSPGAGAVAGNAQFQFSDDAGATWQNAGQAHTCATGPNGNCQDPVRVKATARGVYRLAASIGGVYLDNAASGQPSSVSPVEIWFREGPAAQGQAALNDTADKLANYGLPGPGQGDSYTIAIEVADAGGNGVTTLTDADLTKTCAAAPAAPGYTCPADLGLVFGPLAPDAAKGDGHYTLPVYSTRAGAKNIGLWVSGMGAALPKAGSPGQRHVTATFHPLTSIDPAKSSFNVAQSAPKFRSNTNNPAAVYFHTGAVELKDANGNPITGALTTGKLTWAEADPPASRVQVTEDTAPGREGFYLVKIWSARAATYSGHRFRFAQADGGRVYLTESQSYRFIDDDPTAATSSMAITDDPDQPANHGAPGSSAATWGKQTITVTLQDPAGGPYEAAVGRLTAASPDPGVAFAAPTGAAGAFGCASPPVQGPCPSGVYSLDVYSSLAGAKRVAVTYTGAVGGSFKVTERGTGADFVTALFTTPPADPAASVFVLGDPVLHPDETNPPDDWDDPADNPDGGDSVVHDTGIPFHANVRIWDAGRHNPIDGAEVRLTLAPSSCPAKFATTG
ncbi:MAG: hypothetical protein LBG60_15890, partial [Bifidobacteriaceae bacterium]|nr:hypothetical protein [Bifidobacteriaceae bacterium]